MQEFVFSSWGTQVTSLGSKHLCLLSHLAGPILQSLKVQASLLCHESCFIHSESWVNFKVKFIFIVVLIFFDVGSQVAQDNLKLVGK